MAVHGPLRPAQAGRGWKLAGQCTGGGPDGEAPIAPQPGRSGGRWSWCWRSSADDSAPRACSIEITAWLSPPRAMSDMITTSPRVSAGSRLARRLLAGERLAHPVRHAALRLQQRVVQAADRRVVGGVAVDPRRQGRDVGGAAPGRRGGRVPARSSRRTRRAGPAPAGSARRSPARRRRRSACRGATRRLVSVAALSARPGEPRPVRLEAVRHAARLGQRLVAVDHRVGQRELRSRCRRPARRPAPGRARPPRP